MAINPNQKKYLRVEPSAEFWAKWRLHKTEMKLKGYRVTKIDGQWIVTMPEAKLDPSRQMIRWTEPAPPKPTQLIHNSTVQIQKLPPGKAEGADDLHHWSVRRNKKNCFANAPHSTRPRPGRPNT
jgi:hypothetical protein